MLHMTGSYQNTQRMFDVVQQDEAIITANGHTYAVGNYGSGASVQELASDGRATAGFRDNISHQQAGVSDLIAFGGALIAVGSDEHGAAAYQDQDVAGCDRAPARRHQNRYSFMRGRISKRPRVSASWRCAKASRRCARIRRPFARSPSPT